MKKLNDHELEEWLSEFDIEYPDEEKVEKTIMQLHSYVPRKKPQPLAYVIPTPLRNAFLESLQFSQTFWISNLLYLLLGLSIVFLIEGDPYLTLFSLSPIPIIISLYEIFRSRDQGMMELELSFKFSVSNLILSKLTLVGLFNLACTLLLIFIFSFFATPLVLMDLLQYWAAPYSAIVSISLLLSIKFRTLFVMPISLAIMIFLGLIVGNVIDIHLIVSEKLSIAVLSCAIIGIGLAIRMIKRGVYHEFNH